MTTIPEAIVLAVITTAPFAFALLIAAGVVAAIGEQRLSDWLGLDLGDER